MKVNFGEKKRRNQLITHIFRNFLNHLRQNWNYHQIGYLTGYKYCRSLPYRNSKQFRTHKNRHYFRVFCSAQLLYSLNLSSISNLTARIRFRRLFVAVNILYLPFVDSSRDLLSNKSLLPFSSRKLAHFVFFSLYFVVIDHWVFIVLSRTFLYMVTHFWSFWLF